MTKLQKKSLGIILIIIGLVTLATIYLPFKKYSYSTSVDVEARSISDYYSETRRPYFIITINGTENRWGDPMTFSVDSLDAPDSIKCKHMKEAQAFVDKLNNTKLPNCK